LTSLVVLNVGHNLLTGFVPAPPSPSSLLPGGSTLCPNPFDLASSPNDDFWNVATGITPWWSAGLGQCDALVAYPQFLATAQDEPLSITLTADGDALSYAIVAPPSQGGELTGTPPNVTYTPAPGFNGIEIFMFYATDGTADSNVAAVTITVGDVGDDRIFADGFGD